MIVNIHGNKSHELVDNALRVLENMRHRGAEVGKDGDGAGIMVQTPLRVVSVASSVRTSTLLRLVRTSSLLMVRRSPSMLFLTLLSCLGVSWVLT